MKMSKDSSAIYDQNNKARYEKCLVKGIEVFPQKKNSQSNNMDPSDIKISLKMRIKSLLITEKKFYEIWKNKNASQISTDDDF